MTQNKRQKSNNPPVFDDVVIRLSRKTDGGEGFFAEVRQTPIPLEGGDFQIKNFQQLEELHTLFTGQVAFNHAFFNFNPQLEQMAHDLAELRDKLYKLLPISIRDELPRLIQKVNGRGRGIRLIIEASAGDQTEQLLSLPWELVFIRERQVYPARSRRVLIVRRLLDAARHSPVEMTAPFNLVHVIADDPEQPIELDLQQMERKTIPDTMTRDNYTLVAEPGSVQNLLGVIQTKRSQILHFLGHGVAPEEEKSHFAARGYLCFVNKDGKRQVVTGERLQHLLSGTPELQLIVLNACDSASVITSHLALDLVHSGFPYVVAMQAEMAQEAAKHFIRAFYSELQEGQSIEYAVAAGRMEIASQLPGAIDWCLPVLYTNVGLTDKGLLVRKAEHIGQSIRKVNNLLWITIPLGSLHLVAGLLLWFSGESHTLPDTDFMLWTTGWVVIVPPLLAAWIYRSGQLPIPDDWSHLTRLALLSRLLGAGALYLGCFILGEVWFLVVLFVALGFWGTLSALAQVVLLMPLLLIAIFLSYALTHRSGLTFITSVQVKPELPWFEYPPVPPIAGYALLLISFWLSYDSASLYTPPEGNLFIGALLLGISYFAHRLRADLEDEPDIPYHI